MISTSKKTLIYGPPGTGKTTKLLDIVQDEIEHGVDPSKICFCSFTTKATGEAIERTIKRFNLKPQELPFFKTVHALAFSSLGLQRANVLQNRDYKKIGEHLGLTFATNIPDFSDTTLTGVNSKHKGSQYQNMYAFAKASGASLRDVWDRIDPINLNWFELVRYAKTVEQYKKSRGLTDFSDMLINADTVLPVDVLIIDEAQDLSNAQWKFLEPTMESAKRIYIGGDDDQAIFTWGGANVDRFIDMEGDKQILSQSHRVPKSIYKLSNSIASRISKRTDKKYTPKDVKGDVQYWNSPDHVDLSNGTWLLLARNSYLLNELTKVALDQGVSFSVRGYSRVAKDHTRAIKLWEKWRSKGVELSELDKALIEQYLPLGCKKWPKEKIWHEAFTRINEIDRKYYIELLRNKESLTDKPRINISTIHGSKGGEADNVLLLTDMAYSTWEGMQKDADSEHRVWYVGATRAKHNLHIVSPRGRYHYPL